MRLVFFGTGAFGLPTLKALFASRHKIAAVVTQPDKTGRGHHSHVNPIKAEAEQRTRPILQPENVNAPEVLARLRDYRADVFVTAAYGQLLKQELLDIPPHGAINLHASVLPRHRGAAPIHAAILAGDAETGVTIFRIVRKLDAGPILAVETTPIGPAETTGGLHDRLAELAAPLTLRVLDDLEKGAIAETPQDDALSTYAAQLRKEQGEIDWSKLPAQIVNHVRAMQPWPGAFSTLHLPGREPLRVSVTAVEPTEEPADAAAAPGTVLPTEGELVVQSAGGPLRVVRLKPAGKREMTGADFRRGHSLPPGSRFGA
ncbi:MAG TPA: methionyl-tRNA formyltransferase [Planctomycetaceae bacterium]